MGALKAAEWGTCCHLWKETGVIPGTEDWHQFHAAGIYKKIKTSGISREVLWPAEGMHEVALALNLITGKAQVCKPPPGAEKGYKDRWKAAFDSNWVTGSLDYVMELMGPLQLPWIDDLKTGRHGHPKDYEAQQSFYALAWGLAKYGRVTETRSTITHWPRYPLAQEPRRVGVLFSVPYLNQFYTRLQDLRETVCDDQEHGGPVTKYLVMGDQCTFCPSKDFCPKMLEQVKEP